MAVAVFALDRKDWKGKTGYSSGGFSILGAKKDLKALLFETMDKTVFYKLKPEEEVNQGIAYLLLEMFKLQRRINTLNLRLTLESANEFSLKNMLSQTLVTDISRILQT